MQEVSVAANSVFKIFTKGCFRHLSVIYCKPYEGTYRDALLVKGSYRTFTVYAIKVDEWGAERLES